jgi:hypothetical protein
MFTNEDTALTFLDQHKIFDSTKEFAIPCDEGQMKSFALRTSYILKQTPQKNLLKLVGVCKKVKPLIVQIIGHNIEENQGWLNQHVFLLCALSSIDLLTTNQKIDGS